MDKLSSKLSSVYDIQREQVSQLIRKVIEWCYCHGLLMKSDPNTFLCRPIPVALLPTPMPRTLIQQALTVQTDFNYLFDKISRSSDIISSLKRVLEDDSFSSRLLHIYNTVHEEGIAQPINFMLTRSDYMLDSSPDSISGYSLKQIEFNTISTGYVASAAVTTSLHRFVLRELRLDEEDIAKGILANDCLQVFAKGMYSAWRMYNNEKAIILYVVVSNETNICDQRHLEYATLKMHPSIRFIRCTLEDIADNATLTDDRRLYYHQNEVALVYYRSAYAPYCYPNEKAWDARLLVERSKSIKCPNIASHLAGIKKVQQVLAEPGILESLLSDKEAILRMRTTFTGLYSLEGSEGEKAMAMAIKNPEKYVLKPPREGGGNNLFGDEIRTFLTSAANESERSSYILMDRIFPPVTRNALLRDSYDIDITEEFVSELGIFGVYLSRGSNEILSNVTAGYLLRTKNVSTNEGGIGLGAAVLDTPFLI